MESAMAEAFVNVLLILFGVGVGLSIGVPCGKACGREEECKKWLGYLREKKAKRKR